MILEIARKARHKTRAWEESIREMITRVKFYGKIVFIMLFVLTLFAWFIPSSSAAESLNAVAQVPSKEQGREDSTRTNAAKGQPSAEAPASPEAQPPVELLYSGGPWTRSTLTGDWVGMRSELAAKGITFDISLTQIYQGVVDGGKEEEWEYGGRGNLMINLDTQKLGLWPGGFFSVELEGNFGHSVNEETGSLMPVNSNQLYPLPPTDNFAVPQVSFTQFLCQYAGVYAGKVDTTFGDMNEFAHGKGDNQFFNLALNFNPVAALAIPSSTLSTGLIILPNRNPESAVINLGVNQTNGQATTSGFDDLSSDKLTFAGEGRVRTRFFGLTGHQLLGAGYSNAEFTSLKQDIRVIVEPLAIREKDGSWFLYYNFDQFLYEPRENQGIGIFGRFGASDGDPNLIHYFYSLGIGAKGFIPGRSLDEFGVGYYYLDITNPELEGPIETLSFLRDEQGIEAYYKFAVTPWMLITPDIQIVRPAQKHMIDVVAGQPVAVSKEDIDTAVVLGLRLKLIF